MGTLRRSDNSKTIFTKQMQNQGLRTMYHSDLDILEMALFKLFEKLTINLSILFHWCVRYR